MPPPLSLSLSKRAAKEIESSILEEETPVGKNRQKDSPRSASNILSVSNLSKAYSDFQLENVTFSISKGEVVGLVGSNGAGKTTTIKSILGLMRPDRGRIEVLDTCIYPESSNSSIHNSLGLVGTAFDTVAFPENITVKDVRWILRITNTRFDYDKFDQYCKTFNLAVKKKIKELSRGMGMKLSLAAALSSSPRLLILDEPTAGLDPLAREELLGMLSDFVCDNTGILMSSHITSDLEKIADRIVCIDDGKLIFNETKESILQGSCLAFCQKEELDQIVKDKAQTQIIRLLDQGSGFVILVTEPDVFISTYPQIRTEHTTIDGYMNLMLKGAVL